MFENKIDSWEKLVSEFADMLDSSNMEAWPYVDLTDQSVGTHINSAYADPTYEEEMNGHELCAAAVEAARTACDETCHLLQRPLF